MAAALFFGAKRARGSRPQDGGDTNCAAAIAEQATASSIVHRKRGRMVPALLWFKETPATEARYPSTKPARPLPASAKAKRLPYPVECAPAPFKTVRGTRLHRRAGSDANDDHSRREAQQSITAAPMRRRHGVMTARRHDCTRNGTTAARMRGGLRTRDRDETLTAARAGRRPTRGRTGTQRTETSRTSSTSTERERPARLAGRHHVMASRRHAASSRAGSSSSAASSSSTGPSLGASASSAGAAGSTGSEVKAGNSIAPGSQSRPFTS